MEYVSTRPDRPLSGEVAVPGDKSLSHRAVLFAAMAEGTSRLTGVLDSEDVHASIGAVRALGANVEIVAAAGRGLEIVVTGWGEDGPCCPDVPIDCGNSGTTARLLLGILAGWDTEVTLIGDESLSKRPMGRVTDPLTLMGASFDSPTGTLPVTVRGGALQVIDYATPVASAQVKSAILLAGLRAAGRTTVREPAPSRDHTELLLPAFSVPVGRDPAARVAWVEGPAALRSSDITVPGDPSSAAFMVAASLLVPGSRITVTGVGLNPTRIAYLDVLDRMGADIRIQPFEAAGGEPVGAVRVGYTRELRPAIVRAAEVPALVDEIPVLALLATQAAGETRFEDVGELRVKESDRLTAVVEGLTLLGASAHVEGDTLVVRGPADLRGARLDSRGDHRLSMTWALAGLPSDGPVTVSGFEAVDVSYPSFAADLAALSAKG